MKFTSILQYKLSPSEAECSIFIDESNFRHQKYFSKEIDCILEVLTFLIFLIFKAKLPKQTLQYLYMSDDRTKN